MITAPAWQRRGACRGVAEPLWDYVLGPDVIEYASARAARLAEGKRICNICPVAIQCFQWGYTHRETGLWGGQLIGPKGVVRIPGAQRHARKESA